MALRLLFATCRVQYVGDVLRAGLKKLDDPTNTEYYVLCVWHDSLLLPTFAAPKPLRKRCCCLVSRHQDGSYLADAMSWMVYATVESGMPGRARHRHHHNAAARRLRLLPVGPMLPGFRRKRDRIQSSCEPIHVFPRCPYHNVCDLQRDDHVGNSLLDRILVQQLDAFRRTAQIASETTLNDEADAAFL